MQYRRVLHNPLHIINAAAAQQIAAVVAGIIVPYRILQRQCFFSVQGIEDILIRQNQLFAVLLHIPKELLRGNFLSPPLQIHQQNTGIIIVVLCSQPHLINTVRQLGFAGMRSRRKKIFLQIGFPQRTDGIDDQGIRIKIKNTLDVLWQQVRCQQAIVHFLWILLCHRCLAKQRILYFCGKKGIAVCLALLCHALQLFFRDAAVQQSQGKGFLGIIHGKRGQHHLQLRKISFIQGGQKINLFHWHLPRLPAPPRPFLPDSE